MTLLDYLSSRSVGDLQAVASRIGLSGSENSKQRLVLGIARRLSNKEALAGILEQLSEDAYELLRFLVIRGSESTTFEDLYRDCEERSQGEFLAAIRELEGTGLLGVQVDSGKRMDLFLIFEDLREQLLSHLRPAEMVQQARTPTPRVIHSHSNVWQDDLLTVVGFCLRNEARVTQLTHLAKRHLRRLEPLLRGTRLAELRLRFTGREVNWPATLLHLLESHGVIREMDGRALVDEEAANAFLTLLDLLSKDWRECLTATRPAYAAPADYARIKEVLGDSEGQAPSWRRVDDLVEAVRPRVQLFSGAGSAALVRSALFNLMAFGHCELGEDENEWYWRASSPPETLPEEAVGVIHLQPNFELIAPALISRRARLTLERIADLTGVDQLLHYRITKESVYGGLCGGWTAARQIDWYSAQLGERRTIPQNVRKSIEAWDALYGRLSVEAPLLLVCDSAELADEVLHNRKLAPLVLGRFTPRHLLLRLDSGEEALATLREMGFLPHPEVGDGVRWLLDRTGENR
ncbi:MAG: helicase-associated domain-containing protein [Candidatus Omnitrophica bacterium]|nr:hypothetical protein [bacterium]NUN94837.1 helicase-associated domain-containing protein [Candidatus Omnitrophota bacterium]